MSYGGTLRPRIQRGDNRDGGVIQGLQFHRIGEFIEVGSPPILGDHCKEEAPLLFCCLTVFCLSSLVL